MRVQVYRNLNNHMVSIKDPSTGLVLGHAESIDIEGVTCIVREGGRQRVLNTGHKNVHAFMCGVLTAAVGFKPFNGRGITLSDRVEKHYPNVVVKYNPYVNAHFINDDTHKAITRMVWCKITCKGTMVGDV